jgi:hypothetical protein
LVAQTLVCVQFGLAGSEEHRLMVRNAHHKSLCYNILRKMSAKEPDET